MFKQLHIKLTMYMGLILAVFMVFISSGIFFFTKYVFDDQIGKLMQQEASRIYVYNSAIGPIEKILLNKNFLSISSKMFYLRTSGLNSNYVAYDDELNIIHIKTGDNDISGNMRDLVKKCFELKADSFEKRKIDGISYRIYTKYCNDEDDPEVIQVYEDTGGEEYFWSFLKTVLYLTGSLGAIILIGISYVFTGKSLKPVKTAWSRQKEFVADASHELRTPLTVIQTNLDVVLCDEDGYVKDNEVWLDNAYSETRVMAKLIDQLLTLANADSDESQMEMLEISLSEIAENVCDNMQMIARKKNINLLTEIEDNVIIKGDYDKVRRLAVILVDNAVKYTENGDITVKVYTEKNKKVISVQDTGIGISDEDKKRIFDRFYRADKARSRTAGGAGLGLSIAKWIVDAHKATIEVESKLGEGSKFIVKFN